MAGPMDDKAAKLELYENLLRRWGAKINLIGPEATRNLKDHLGEAVEAATYLELRGNALDFGSGGGLPGIPLAILGGSEIQFHLVEAEQKKWVFLKAAVRECGLNCIVHGDRLTRVVPLLDASLRFDLITSRAVGHPEKWLPEILPRLNPGGKVALFQSNSGVPAVPGLIRSSTHRLARGDRNYLVVLEVFHVEQHG